MSTLEIAEEKGLKDVLVFRLCECDAVAAFTLEEAKLWYTETTGITDDEMYDDGEIEVVSLDYQVYKDEDTTDLISVREIVETHWNGEPFIVFSTLY
ncbi:hypothetical protein [Brevibacillus reuszeri]|uniref:hypothetical protein n=1 Tax=Brevibacillus reuszeri TaxID=54915 RepID=UPI000CCBFB1F|nr:hypothetical protein [Brevibacillus reuszeri]